MRVYLPLKPRARRLNGMNKTVRLNIREVLTVVLAPTEINERHKKNPRKKVIVIDTVYLRPPLTGGKLSFSRLELRCQ